MLETEVLVKVVQNWLNLFPLKGVTGTMKAVVSQAVYESIVGYFSWGKSRRLFGGFQFLNPVITASANGLQEIFSITTDWWMTIISKGIVDIKRFVGVLLT